MAISSIRISEQTVHHPHPIETVGEASERHHGDAIKTTGQRVQELREELAEAKRTVTKLNKELELTLNVLVVRAVEGPENRPLIDHLADDPAPTHWRNVTLENIGFTAKIVRAFKEAGVTTAGGYCGLVERHGPGRWVEHVKNIGPAMGEEIEERMTDWLAENIPAPDDMEGFAADEEAKNKAFDEAAQ